MMQSNSGKISPWLHRELEPTARQGHMVWPLYECSFTSAEHRDGVLGSSPMLYPPSLHTGTTNQWAESVEKDVVDPSAGVDHQATQNRGWCRHLNPGTWFQNAVHPRSRLDCSRSDRRSNKDNHTHVQRSEFWLFTNCGSHKLCCELVEFCALKAEYGETVCEKLNEQWS